MSADFTHLHVHTQYSLLDGALRLDELFKAATHDKMEAVALTDHGHLFGAVDFYVKAKEHGVKPIIGCEVYMAPGSRLMKGTHTSADDEVPPYSVCRSGMYHLILLCQNELGYQNLCRLVSSGHLEGFYYKPRVDKEILEKYNEGLIALSGCLKGEMASLCLLGDMDRASTTLQWYCNVFKDRFYLEMQQSGLPQQYVINQRFQELAQTHHVPLVATSDCHYLRKEDASVQEVLMCIQTGRTLEDPSRIQVRTDEFYFKPQSIIKEEFAFCPQAISNTMEIARQCTFEFRFQDEKGKKIYHFPKFTVPSGQTLENTLCTDARNGLQKRLIEIEEMRKAQLTGEERTKYSQRLERELKVINEMGFAGYYLIVADFISHAKEHDIPVGPGRGSGAGSLVAYSLRITELDPLEHGLLFERFLNPERVSLPDFDIDFCMDKRERIIDYVSEKYGHDCVAQIITYGKLQARGVIRDVARVFGLSASESDKITKLIPAVLNVTLNEAFEQEVRLRQLTEKDPKIHQLFQICRALEGLYRHASIHAAGIVISNRPMVEHCPLSRGKNGELVIQYDMNNAERIGLIKFDFLGLKTLTFLKAAEVLVNQRYPDSRFDLCKIDLSAPPMFKLLSEGDTSGVFQMESSGMQELMKRIHPDSFGDITAINALYRPGPIGSGMMDDFIARKHGSVPIQYDFEELRPILQETYGVIVYQEQVQQIAVRLANYTSGGADLLRRAMGKKKAEEMARQKAIFVDGAIQQGFNRAKIEHLFDIMEKFAGYGFNKSHAAAYSLITCQTAYLKAHYPVEFYATLLSIERDNTDKITKYIADAKRHDIDILRPDINESETDFTVLTNQKIRFGLGAIKGVGQVAIESVLEARKKGGPFKDLYDLCFRTNNRTVNKRVLEAFVKAGALDSFGVHRSVLFASIDSALGAGSSLQKICDEQQPSFSDLLGMDDSSLVTRKIAYADEKPWPRLLELKFEKETIGFFVTGHPLDNFKSELERYTTGSVADCNRCISSRDFLLGANVVALREILTKRGDRMAFATLEDKSGQIEAVIFSDVFIEAESVLKSGEPVWLKGQLEAGERGNKLLLSKKNGANILPLKYAFEALAQEIHLNVSVRANQALPETVLKALQNYLHKAYDKKGAPLFVHLLFEGRADAVLKMKETVPLRRDTIENISKLFEDHEFHVAFR
ncbi:MAG: DNA polymerase III subunit alpha [Deltaproteobacteria bacterium]|nr:DNA polymerase III subunit alpha [Deltaproteobacteria bacterium]